MAQKALIGGTAYDIKDGKTLIGGTGYTIKSGKTLVGGTAYSIKLSDGASIRLIADYSNLPAQGSSTNAVDAFGMIVTGPDGKKYANIAIGPSGQVFSDNYADYYPKQTGVYHDLSFEAPLNSTIKMFTDGVGGENSGASGIEYILNGTVVYKDDKTITASYTLESVTGDIVIKLNDPSEGVNITMEG